MLASIRSLRGTSARFARWLGAALVVFNLLLVSFAAWMLLESRQNHLRQANTTTLNLARVLEQNMQATMHQIDLVLQVVADEVEQSPAGLQNPLLPQFLQTQHGRLGLLDTLRLADAEGQVRHAVPTDPTPQVAARSFFQRLKQPGSGGLIISRAARDGRGGTWAITLARRVSRTDGSFGGAVIATLNLERLAQDMAQVDVGPHGTISLRGADLGLLIRYPAFPGQDALLGDTHVAGDYLTAVQSQRTTYQFAADSRLDGTHRVYTLRQFGQPKFYLLVGLAEQDFLTTWRRAAAFTVVAALGLVGLTVILGWLVQSAWRRQTSDQRRLAAQEAKFRLLAENALDVIWSADAEGHLTYLSPSMLAQRGWTPEEFMGLTQGDGMHTAQGTRELRALIASARALPPGTQPPADVANEVEVLHRDGHPIQVEVRTRVVWSEDGRLIGLQGVSRDVTERKRMESERDTLIQELKKALSEVKALSGLLPICSHCKKVRDDGGYWNQIESYLSQHSEATFTHGICPDCAATFRAELRSRRPPSAAEGDLP